MFDSQETTHAEINVQNFVTQKKLMQNFLSQKNACKNKSSKIFDYLVRVHNDIGLELCEREGSGKVPARYKTGTSRRKLREVRQPVVRYKPAYETSRWAGK